MIWEFLTRMMIFVLEVLGLAIFTIGIVWSVVWLTKTKRIGSLPLGLGGLMILGGAYAARDMYLPRPLTAGMLILGMLGISVALVKLFEV